MNAALRKTDLTEGAHVPVNETDALAIQVAELRADTDIKAELRATNERVDERFDKVDTRFEKLEQKCDALKDSLSSAKIWALGGLYIALSGTLLYVMAHGFKWL